MKKKLLGIALTILICIMSFSCSGSDSPSGLKSGSDKNPGSKLTIAARSGSHADIINAVKADFESSNKCEITVIALEGSELHDSILHEAESENGSYDIVMIDDPLMPEYIEKDVLSNLTKLGYMDDEDFVEKSRLLGKDPYPLGATYSLPFSGNVQLIFYNSALTGENPDLTNWQSILQLCQSVNTTGKKGYAVRGQTGNPIVSDFLPILWAFGGDIFDEYNHVILDSHESRDALSFYCELYKTGDNYEKNDLIDAITNGDAAIALGWPSWFISGTGSQAEIAQIPGKKDSTASVLSTGEIGNWLLGITSNSSNKELALECIKYLTSADVQKKALEYGGIPTRKSIFRNKDILASYPFFEAIYSGTNNSRVRPRTTKWSRIEDVFGAELVKCINGEQSIDETIIKSQAAIENLAIE